MELLNGVIVKQFEDHKVHFEERLLERYGIVLKKGEYEKICSKTKFNGVLKKSASITIGYIHINDIKVWVMRSSKHKSYSTCYPPDVETNIDSTLRACFGLRVRKFAEYCYGEYVKELNALPEFNCIKDAAIYYFSNTMFPTLHIDKFKYGVVDNFKICTQIERILNCDHPHILFTIQKKGQWITH